MWASFLTRERLAYGRAALGGEPRAFSNEGALRAFGASSTVISTSTVARRALAQRSVHRGMALGHGCRVALCHEKARIIGMRRRSSSPRTSAQLELGIEPPTPQGCGVRQTSLLGRVRETRPLRRSQPQVAPKLRASLPCVGRDSLRGTVPPGFRSGTRCRLTHCVQ